MPKELPMQRTSQWRRPWRSQAVKKAGEKVIWDLSDRRAISRQSQRNKGQVRAKAKPRWTGTSSEEV